MALEGLVPLWAISHGRKSRIECPAVWMDQPDAGGNQKKRVDAEA
jgi:hypothetical protein